MRRAHSTLAIAALSIASALSVARPALAVPQCGPEVDSCQCGANNPFPCCDNGGNCTWWAWESACCHWGVSVPMLGNANTWAGVAASDPNYEVLPYPVVNSIAVRASGAYGHVAWVKSVGSSTIVVSEMNCWGGWGVIDTTYYPSFFDGGYVVRKGSQCACNAGESQSQPCGDCGTHTRKCGSNCQWEDWGACAGPAPGGSCDTGEKGACAAGTLACVDGNTQCQGATEATGETCDGVDNDCDGSTDEDEVCEREVLLRGQSWVAPARTTDIDADGRADVCGRGSSGVWCHLSTGKGWATAGPVLGLSDEQGWNDPTNFSTFRMGDIDGDGRADLCARANAAVGCWKSDGKSLVTPVPGPEWSDESGWGKAEYHSTMRLLDMDADGKDDLCGRAAKGIVCAKSSGTSFQAAVDGPPWSDSAGLNQAKYYGTLRTGDVDGDRKQDLCMRTKNGMECWLSDGKGFPKKIVGPDWSDASGWGAMEYWTTIRLADVNGDGKADLCARGAKALECRFSQGSSFGPAIQVAPLADSSGWNDASNYLTLRVGDLDGDGAQDLCVRANAAVQCHKWNGTAFATIAGPEWSDADGWNKPEYFHTIQLGDMNGDGKADLCGRHASGWRCHPSTGTGFGAAVPLDEFTDPGGWAADKYYATLLFGGPSCVPHAETCNGQDDDCDGDVDEGACPAGQGDSGSSDASWTGDSGSGEAGTWGADSSSDSGCGCRVSSTMPRGSVALMLLSTAALLALRLRRKAPSPTSPPRAGDVQEGLGAAAAVGDDRLQRRSSGRVGSREAFSRQAGGL